jgi:hypothetical protein
LKGESCTDANTFSSKLNAVKPYIYYEQHYGTGSGWSKVYNSSGAWTGEYFANVVGWVTQDSNNKVVVSWDSPAGWYSGTGAGTVRASETWSLATFKADFASQYANPLADTFTGSIYFYLGGTYPGQNWQCNGLLMSAGAVWPSGKCSSSGTCVPGTPPPQARITTDPSDAADLGQVAGNFSPGSVFTPNGGSVYYTTVPYSDAISGFGAPQPVTTLDQTAGGITVHLEVDVTVISVAWYSGDADSKPGSSVSGSPSSLTEPTSPVSGFTDGLQGTFAYAMPEQVTPKAVVTVMAQINRGDSWFEYGGSGHESFQFPGPVTTGGPCNEQVSSLCAWQAKTTAPNTSHFVEQITAH